MVPLNVWMMVHGNSVNIKGKLKDMKSVKTSEYHVFTYHKIILNIHNDPLYATYFLIPRMIWAALHLVKGIKLRKKFPT
jgi:hypothetical protein